MIFQALNIITSKGYPLNSQKNVCGALFSIISYRYCSSILLNMNQLPKPPPRCHFALIVFTFEFSNDVWVIHQHGCLLSVFASVDEALNFVEPRVYNSDHRFASLKLYVAKIIIYNFFLPGYTAIFRWDRHSHQQCLVSMLPLGLISLLD